MEQKLFLSWLAGFVDGDGCMSISVSFSNNQFRIIQQVRIALKENDDWILKEIQETTNIGKIYYSNKGKDNSVCSWQTVSYIDAIKITELILPYLRLKKHKAVKFLEALKLLDGSKKEVGGKRQKGVFLRDKETYLKIIEIATTLNNDRQTKRYREYKNYDYWSKKLDEIFKK